MSDAPERISLQGYGQYIRAGIHAAEIARLNVKRRVVDKLAELLYRHHFGLHVHPDDSGSTLKAYEELKK